MFVRLKGSCDASLYVWSERVNAALVAEAVMCVFCHLRLVCDEKTHVPVFNFCGSWPDDLPGHFAAEKSRVRPLGILNNLGICTVNIPRNFAEPRFREWFIGCRRRLFSFYAKVVLFIG